MSNNHIKNQSLKMFLWNVNGLKQNEPELHNLLFEKQIDVALISETHYTQNKKHFFSGYNVYITGHPDGTAIKRLRHLNILQN